VLCSTKPVTGERKGRPIIMSDVSSVVSAPSIVRKAVLSQLKRDISRPIWITVRVVASVRGNAGQGLLIWWRKSNDTEGRNRSF
jgi:hypothetical protein